VVVEKLKGTRRERAQQFFNSCLIEKLVLTEPATLEKEIESCVERIRSIGSSSSWWKLDAWKNRF
jgi:myo-inositol catabolism protein IolC